MYYNIPKEEINSFYKNEDGRYPMLDGIVNVELYAKSKYRIMWICKESYDKATGTGNYSLVDDINEDPKGYSSIFMLRRIAITSNAILKSCDYEASVNDEKYHEALRNISLINVNKLPESTSSAGRDGEIAKCYTDTKALLLKQINIANPNIIIFGAVFHNFLTDLNLDWEDGKNLEFQNRSIFIKENRVYIDAYHPSFIPNRKVNEEKYCNSISNAFVNALTNNEIVI